MCDVYVKPLTVSFTHCIYKWKGRRHPDDLPKVDLEAEGTHASTDIEHYSTNSRDELSEELPEPKGLDLPEPKGGKGPNPNESNLDQKAKVPKKESSEESLGGDIPTPNQEEPFFGKPKTEVNQWQSYPNDEDNKFVNDIDGQSGGSEFGEYPG